MRAIGIDIGGTGIKAGRIGDGADIEDSATRPTPADRPAAATLPLLLDLVRRLDPGRGRRPLPVGVGCAGLVDHELGRVYSSPNLPGWTDEVPLADLLEDALGARPVVLNDANAFVLAEARLGAGRGAASIVGLTLGTGVGGGVVLEGKLWTGRSGTAGEIGHMVLQADGPRCACGARGCLEALVGTRAILERYRAGAGPDPGRTDAAADEVARADVAGAVPGAGAALAGAAAPLTPQEIALRARAGDSAARATFEETGRLLGLALVGLTHLLDPELFIIGGGVAGAADLLLPAAAAALRDGSFLPERLLPRIVPASLGADAGWIGAALAALDRTCGS